METVGAFEKEIARRVLSHHLNSFGEKNIGRGNKAKALPIVQRLAFPFPLPFLRTAYPFRLPPFTHFSFYGCSPFLSVQKETSERSARE